MFNKINILKPFFEDPLKQLGVRETSRIIKLSPATTSKKLKLLKKQGILEENKFKNYILYKANIENENYRDLKIYYNIKKIRESGLIEELNKFYNYPSIILFGSHRYGYDYKESDIDLVIISENTKEFPRKTYFEKKFSKELHLFPVKDLKFLKNEYLILNVLKGFELQGDIKRISKNVLKMVQ